ncbi:MAG: outer membrane protein transport protein [Polyangiales bacterium]
MNRFSAQLLLNPIFVNTSTPVGGANMERSTGTAFGPLGAAFLAGRIADRVVLGAGFYIEQGYGATFDNVINVDGAAGNTEGEDLSVRQFNGEAAVGTSFEITDRFSVGLALRLPFAVQTADLYQNVGAGLGAPITLYARVKNELSGVGFPSPRFGIHYQPNKHIEFGAMYRMYSKINMHGTTRTSLLGPDPLLASANWVVPHAVQGGLAAHLLDQKLMLVGELRLQFHDAKKHGNEDQTVVVSNTPIPTDPVVAPFNWRNVWSVKLGGEYRFSELFALRAGGNIAVSNIREAYAQYFTPPPGFSPAVTAGFGFHWDHVDLDFATLISWSSSTIDPSVSAPGQTITAGDRQVQVCSSEQVVRTGCAGKYKTNSYWASINLTYRL